MRTTDELNPEPPFKPFGEKVVPPPPPPKPVQGEGPSGFTTDSEGRIRTTTHRPHGW